MQTDPDPARLEALRRDAADAVAFQAIKSGAAWWTDAPPPDGTGAMLAYQPAGRSWIAVGTPLVAPERRAEAVRRFVQAARAQRRRPIFFGVEDLAPFAGCRTLVLGLQSVLRVSQWPATLRERPRLREQLRRARAKGVTVRHVDASELADGTPLRQAVERLRSEWLGSRAMEPMGFLVDVEPFYAAEEHLYVIAERKGSAVQFLSAIPIHARDGWLMEDMLRGASAPNGTTELIIDALMRQLAAGRTTPDAAVEDSGAVGTWVTPGLTPLTGPIPWWLRATRTASVALYDFSGLWRFRSRLRPAAWRPVWMAWDRGPAPLVLIDVLRAFAGGRIVPFAWRSLTRHPNGPPWAVAVPLVPWTALLAVLLLSGRAGLLGYPATSLQRWVIFDMGLAWLLFRAARRPRPRRLAAVAVIAAFDAAVSLRHVAAIGVGVGVAAVLRTLATLGPLIGTTALAWAAWRAHRREAGR